MSYPHTFASLSGSVPASYLDDNFNAAYNVATSVAYSFVGNIGSGAGNNGNMTAAQAYAILKTVIPWEYATFQGGAPGASWMVGRYQPSTAIAITPASCQASAGTASTGTAVFAIAKNGTNVGTVTFTASATGVVAFTGSTTLSAGDKLTITAPGSADATLADVNITLAGNRA